MDKYPSEVFIVFFDTVIELLDVSLIEKPQHFLLELPTAFAGDNLNQFDLSIHRFFNDLI